MPTVCFLDRRVYASPGETKGTKTPLAGARAYVQTRRRTRAQARVPDGALAAVAEGRPGRPRVEKDAPRPPVRPGARQASPGLGRDP